MPPLPARTAAAAAVSALAALAGIGAARALRVRGSVAGFASYWAGLSDGGPHGREHGHVPAALYVALGDSTAQGVGASRPERGYVGLLAAGLAVEGGRPVSVVNLSTSGARVADVRNEQVPRLRDLLAGGARPALVTLAAGANDAGRTDPEAFRHDLAAVLDALPPGALVADLPDFGGGPRLRAAAALTDVVREEVARRPGLVPVALATATAAMGWRDYGGDWFHPGDRGYRRWAAAFAEARAPGAPTPGADPGEQPRVTRGNGSVTSATPPGKA